MTIQGQNFSVTPSSNTVTFNGILATVVSASASELIVTVPSNAMTGNIAVTVSGNTATAANPFTVISSPAVLSVNPQFSVSSSAASTIASFTVAGANLSGATFNFAPAFSPAAITVNSATINAGGTSATLSLSVAAAVKGSFTLLATNAAGSSSPVATSANTLQIIAPDDDADGDGVTNAVEIAIGSNPLNAQTSGAGISDGWQVFYGLNPLSASSAGPDPAGSGNTALQDFQQGLSPVNKNRVPPAVVQVAPANAATGVPINSVVVVRFGEPLRTGTSLAAAQSAIAAALGTNTSVSAASRATAALTLQGYMNRTCCGNSVIPGTVVVSGPYGAITGGVTASSDGLSVTFSPSVPLTSNTTYTVQVNGMRDAAGNLMTVPFTSTFTTNASVDNTPPTVKLVDPENNSTGVPTNAHYTVQFSKAIDPGTLSASTFTIYDQTAGANLSGTVQVDASLMTASFIPDQPLPVGRNFTVTFTTGIKDTSGNPLAASVTDYFSTGYTPQTAAQHFVASSPVNGATGIPVNALIDLAFSQPVNLTTVVPNIQVSTGGQAIPVQMAVSSGDQRVSITPVSGLQPNTTYTVSYGAGITNIAGVALDNPGSVSFQTSSAVDKTALMITSWSPASGATGVPLNTQVRAAFNKQVDVTSLGSTNVLLYQANLGTGYPIAGTITPSADQTSVTFAPAAPLVQETQYCLSLVSVIDLEGNALSGHPVNCFTTGTGTASAGPAVTAVSPANGSTGVPVNAVVEVALNEAVSAVSVGQSAITVTAGGQAVAGAVTMPNSTTLLFTPSANLAVSTAYTVTVSGFADVAGNPVTTFTSGFTTGSSLTPVKSGPTVVSVNPVNGAIGVAVNTPIVMTFSAGVNPLTVNTSTFQVYSTANNYILSGTYSANGAVVTFTPLSPLPGGATIRVYESGVQDPAGNNASSSSTSFTTAATADTTAPTVVMVSPSNGQTGVGVNGQVVVVFSKSMNPSTLTTNTIALLAGDTKQSFSTSISSDNRTLTLSSLNLPASTVITLAISSSATDLSGNDLTNFTSQFTTATAFDTNHATVVTQRPGNGATGVATTAIPVVLFVNRPLNAASITGNTVQVTQNGQLVSGTLSVVGNGQTVEFTPVTTWIYGALVQVFLDSSALDAGGNTVTAYKGSFTVASDPTLTAPALVSVNPMNSSTAVPLNAVIHLQYNQPLNAATITAQDVELYGSNGIGAVPATISLDSTGNLLQVVPTSQLTASRQYCVYINYFQAGFQASNGLAVPSTGQCFTTGTTAQTTAPTVVTASPADKLANVPLNADVDVMFSEPVDPVSVTGATISVTGGGTTAIPASISFSNSNTRVLITPEAPLPASTAMTLTISGVTDVAGNAVTAQTTHFTTGTAAATATFGVLVANPAPSATGVPVNASISLQANAEIDGTTVTSSSFQLYDQTLNKYVSGTYSLSADSTTVYFVPATQLATGRTYTVNFVNQGITDVAGNMLSYGCSGCQYNYTFTTGFATSTAPPQVIGVSPANGLTGVPINAQVVVSFNEPVNAESLGGVTLSTNGAAVALTTILSSGNQLLTILPAAGLLPNTAYTLTIVGVADQSGNTMASPVTSTFTTGGTVDLTPLTIVSVAPVNGSTGVPLNAQVRVGFSKGVNIVSLAGGNLVVYPTSIGSSYPLAGTLTVSSDGKNVTFTPTSNLLAETQYSIYVSGVVDLEGQSLSGYSTSYFTTGGSAQSSGPTVVAVSPGNGTSGIPVNTVIEVGLNEPVSAVSVSSSAISLTANGKAVAGTLTMPNTTTLLFTPAAALSVSTAYTVTVGGFTDLAGNAAMAFTSSFTTGISTTPVTTGPTVSVTPANNATNVAVNTPVVATFSTPVNPLTVNASTFQVYSTANNYVLSGSYVVNGAVATFTPLSPLPGGATIRIYEYGVQDTAGNTASTSSTSFTTAATADTTAPTVVSVTPANGQTGVGLNGQVVIVFSKSMNPSTLSTNTIALLAADTKQGFSVSASSDNRTFTLSGLNLPGSTVITLAISSAAVDLEGNALANYTSQFTTAPAFDTTHASVVNQRPANGATGVLTTASPVVLFLNKPLNASSITGTSVQVTQNGQLVNGTLAVVGNGQTIQFTPSTTWTYGSLVQVFLDANATDNNGNTVNAYKGSFTVVSDPAVTAPALLNVNPMNSATGVPLNTVIHLQYNEPLNASTITAQDVELYSSGVIASTVSLDSTGTLLQVVPKSQLAAGKQYCVYVNYAATGLQDTNGQVVPTAYQCFTTGTTTQTSAPSVVTVSPADKLANVPVNANVSVVFSGPIDPVSVTGATISVTGGGSTAIPSTISFSNNNAKVLITPEAPLPASTSMTLTISGVTDVAGNAVAAVTTHFTTGTAATISTFGVLVENPTVSATSVPVNAAISLQTNGEIDGTTVSSSTFKLYDQTLNTYISGTYSLSTDGATVYFVPTTQLATGRTYSVYFSGEGMTDVAGNPLTSGCSGCQYDYSFTTGFAAGTSAPQVTGVSPANGLTKVPINAQIVVSFNEPVNAESLGGVTLSVNGTAVGLSAVLSSGNQLLTITPQAGLLPNTTYTITISGVVDLSGHAMTTPVTSSFTTGGTADLTPLTITSLAPANGTTGVPLNAQVRIGFSKGVDIVSLAGGNLVLYPYSIGSSYPVAGTLSVSSDGTSVTFTPTTNLLAETLYGVYVSGVVDLEGQALSSYGASTFTTGGSAQAGGPSVVSVSPGNTTTGIPVNVVIEVGLNEAISAVSVGQSAITVTAGGQAVAGTVTMPTSTTLLFTPSSNLAVSTSYTVTVGGFTDLSGNAATSFTSSFTTSSSSTPVKTGPTVSVTPSNNATNVPVTSAVVASFSAPVNPLTVTPSTFQVFSAANSYILSGTYAVSGSSVTFTPLNPLPGGATIRVYISGVQDTAGNTASGSSTSFTTATTADTTVPVVTMVTPSNGQTNVGSNGQVVVVFSKSMNPSTLNTSTVALLAGDVKQSFNLSVSADNRTILLSNLSLPASTVVTLAISSGAIDLNGNALANFTSQFTTAAAFDTTHASVVNQRPADGATGVSPSASPVVFFLNKPLNPSTITGNTVQITQNGQLVSGTLSVVGNGQTIEFAPSTTWTYGALVQVFLQSSALDTSGNTVNAYKGSFTTASDPAATAPALINVNPMNSSTAVPLNAVIHLQYNEPLNAATITAQNVELYSNGTAVQATVNLDSTGTLIQVAPAAQLAAIKQYCVYINYFGSGLQGSNGIAVPYTSQCFTTGTATQTSAPTVITVSPADKLSGIPVNTNVAVVFSKAIDPVSVTGTTISVSGGGSTAIPASISFSNANTRVLITPEAPLSASTAMTLTISGVTDVAGNTVATQTTHFTTGPGAATTAFGAVVENPAANSTGVPVNTTISLQTNGQVDGTTVNSSTFQVYDQMLGAYVSGTYSLSTDATTVFFVPAAPLGAGRSYSVYATSQGIADVAGNGITPNCTVCLSNYSFTTGFASSTSAPQVTGLSPSNGLTAVTINAQLVVAFNEPVNALSLAGVTLSANGNTVGLSKVLSSGSQLLTITPVAGLLPNTAYTLTVSGVTDQSGNAMTTPVTSTFTTGGTADLSTLTVVSVSPTSGTTGIPLNAQVQVGFSKAIDTVLLDSGNILLYPNSVGTSYPVAGTLSISADAKSVTLTPAVNLLPETQYCVYVGGVVDLEGQALSSYAYQGCATTGTNTRTTGPAVQSISPANNATGIPVNAVVEVGLNEPVSAVSVGNSAITVTANGTAVAGTVTMPSATTLLFTPTSSLAVSTAYTVTVGRFTDLAGNAATAFTGAFNTSNSSTPVKTGPSVSVTPANNATNVAVTSTVVATFSSPVNPLTVNSSTFQIYSTANNDIVAGSYAVNGGVVTFTPLSVLPGNATIRVYESGVQDTAGNTAASSNTTFTTAATADTTAPTVMMVTPSNGQTGVGLNGQVVIVFSKSMNPSTLTTNTIALLAGETKQNFNLNISSDNRTVVLSSLNLPGSAVITLAISSAVADLSGNALASFTSQFTTAAAFDTTYASVVSQRPASGATGVLTSASPVVLFMNKALNPASVTSNSVQITQNGQVVSGTLSVVGNGQTIQFTPSSAWTAGALVQIFLQTTVLDTSGNSVNAYKGSFTVLGDPATTAPALVNYSPLSGTTAVPLNAAADAQFSSPLDPSTVIASNVYLYSNATGKAIAATLTLDSTGTIVSLRPNAPLAANTSHTFYLYNLKGTDGLTVSNQAHSFTTGAVTQTTAPTILAVNPADKLGNVPLNANIGVLFSGPIDPISITSATVSISGGGASSMPASISFSNSNQKVLITPEAPIPASTAVTLTISGVTDVAGNSVAAQTAHFSTGTTAATSAFGIVVANPPASVTGVPTNAAISLQANGEFDDTSISTSSFQVYDNTLSKAVAGTYSLSADGMTAYFLPATQLATGRTYAVSFYNAGMTDVAGNSLGDSCSGCLYNYSFTTGVSASTAAPQVSGVSPAAGLTGVPINAQIVVDFNEPINGETLGGITLMANGSAVAFSTALSSGNQVLTITPASALSPNTAYTLTVNAVADQSGNAMTTAATSTFTTGGNVDLSTPVVASVTPANSAAGVSTTAAIQIQFNKLMDVLTLTGQTVKLSIGGTTVVPANLTFSQSGNGVTITPSAALSPSTTYTVQVTSSALDLEGNALTAFSSTFSSGTN